MPAGNFATQFSYFHLRNDEVWFEDLPVMKVSAKKSALDINGVYSLIYPNPSGLAIGKFTHFDNQELWFAHIPTNTMYRFMAGQVNRLNPEKNMTLKVEGRALSAMLADRKINDTWTSKRGDFIVCDPTYGIIPKNYSDVTCWQGFTDDYDKFDYWDTARWGAQPAYCEIYDTELDVAGDAGSTRTVVGADAYNYKVIEFRAKVSAASDNAKFGFTNAGRTQYVQFALNAANVTCENSDGAGSQSAATPSTITQTAYSYYRIEWANGEARFFVNGVLEVTETTNVPAANLYPFFEMVTTDAILTLDHMKVIQLTNKLDSYVSKSKMATDIISEICDIGNSVTTFTYYIDDDWDFVAQPDKNVPSGYAYGLNSSIYTGDYQKIASLELNEEAKDLYNFVRITGGEQLTEVAAPDWTDQFIGDGTNTTFTLGYKAKKPLTALEVDGTPVTEDTDFTVTYGTQHTVVKFVTAPAATKTVNVRYDYYTPIIATATNDASFAQYGVRREYAKNDDTITSQDRAEDLAEALLAFFSDPRAVIKITIPLDPRLKIGTTVMVDAPYFGVNDSEYEIIEMECAMEPGVWRTILTLANTEINTSAEIIREILQQLKDLRTRGETSETITELYTLPEEMAFAEALEYDLRYIEDSFIWGHSLNGQYGRGKIFDDFEGSVGAWSGTDCALASETTTYQTGSKACKITPSANSYSMASTQSLGDISAYTGVASGDPTTGTVGLWVYLPAATDLTALSMRIGSSSGDYAEVSGVRTFSGAFEAASGWNYFVFRLKDATTTGTPDWTAADYQRFSFTGVSGNYVIADYDTIGTGDVIALNGWGYRYCLYSTTSLP